MLALALIALVLASAPGCKSDPYCLNCAPSALDGGGDAAPAQGDLAGIDLSVLPDLAGTPCTLTNGGVESCDGVDNDCNGTLDDVAPSKLANDPNNCGACGNACNFTAQKQFGQCDSSSGTPTCKPDTCLPGYFDVDGNPANGCEYACTLSNVNGMGAGVEICDLKDNDCNGTVDDGFDRQNDPNNCGTCGISCARPNAPGNCAVGVCSVVDCASGYKNLDGNASNGCEYLCPVIPPVAETCNAVDDDCDGVKDDSPGDVGEACNTFCGQVAACVATNTCAFALSACTGGCCGICTQGMTVCSGGVEVCQAGARPLLEVCDGVDNNCDGQIDEGFNKQTDPLNCGNCGTVCNLDHVLTHRCTAGGCSIAHNGTSGTTAYRQSGCQPGYSDLNESNSDGCEHACAVYPTTVEVCDGIDNDCNNQVDEPAGMTSPTDFCRAVGLCDPAEPVCCGTAGWLCDYPSVSASIEIQPGSVLAGCKQVRSGRAGVPVGTARQGGALVFAETRCDDLDGDCKGGADDSFLQKNKACTIGIGSCAGSSTSICGGGAVTTGGCMGSANTTTCCPATAQPGNATAEACDGQDNNCDGRIDERVPDTAVLPGALPGYVDRFVQVSASLWVYAYEASRIDSTGASAGTASSGRACAKPGVLPWASVTQAEAAAACNAIVLADGSSRARLCTEAEWKTACEGPTPPAAGTATYSYSATPASYVAQVCNDVNRTATPAVWTTGFDNNQAKECYADWVGVDRQLYDLSGNLMEWTSDATINSGTTYYAVRGGSYNNPAGGTTCQFDFNIFPVGFLNSNVGFRCCASSAP